MPTSKKQLASQILASAGITINGDKPYDVQVHNEQVYARVLADRELGIGEAYMDGWYDVQKLDQFVSRLLSANVRDNVSITPSLLSTLASSYAQNKQHKRRAGKNVSHHYDIGNDLYKRMLDKRMVYSCAYWQEGAATLEQAQEAKFDLICRKLKLKKGMTVLDIGCGWGGFADFAASNYDVVVTGITPSKEQYRHCAKIITNQNVTFKNIDYWDVDGTFDRIVSIGMLEHVGPKNYRTFFRKCYNLLHDKGIMLHHTIGNNRSVTTTNPWFDRYIFPGGVIPSLTQIAKATEQLLVIEDLQNFGPDYDKTLMQWHKRFVKAYPSLKHVYDKRFYRMWEFYLLASAGLFRSRRLQLWQLVFVKTTSKKTYVR